MSTDLVAFLNSRIAEERELALAASPGPWHVDAEGDEVLAADDILVADGFALSGRQLRATTAHIAPHDPARVLRDVAARRKMLSHYESAVTALANAGPSGQVRDLMTGAANTLRAVLLDHAQVYADHPDYREEWRP